jgi:hypothetical protein
MKCPVEMFETNSEAPIKNHPTSRPARKYCSEVRGESSPEVQVWKVEGGQAVDFREFQGDEHTEDEFWSAAAASLDGAGTSAAVGTAG